MKKLLIYFLSLFIVSQTFPQNKSIEKLIEEFKSCNWRRWDWALYQIVDFSKKPKHGPWVPQIKAEYNTSKIKDIIFEFVVVPAGKRCVSIGPPSEGVDEFRIFLLSVMGGLKEDRMIPYLLEDFGSGTQISFVLLGYGEKVIDPIISKLDEGYWEASWALGEMLHNKDEGYTAQGLDRKRIKDALIEVLKKKETINYPEGSQAYEATLKSKADERERIILALAKSGDVDIIPILKEFAKNDIYKQPPKVIKTDKKTTQPPLQKSGQENIYPVREAAQKALEELKQKGVKYE
jgi:hypothetical protein